MGVPGLNGAWARLWLVGVLLGFPAKLRAESAKAPALTPSSDHLVIEADQQASNASTGVITALGNVRLVHPGRGLVATGRQVQYFTREGRIVLSGDVDVVQNDGHSLRADQVTVLLKDGRTVATPLPGQQVVSSWSLQDTAGGMKQ